MLFFSIKDDGENISEYDAKKRIKLVKKCPFQTRTNTEPESGKTNISLKMKQTINVLLAIKNFTTITAIK